MFSDGSVDLRVLHFVAGEAKSSIAHITLEWFFAGMNAHVYDQFVFDRIMGVANVANVRIDGGVFQAFVQSPTGHTVERLRAEVARERLQFVRFDFLLVERFDMMPFVGVDHVLVARLELDLTVAANVNVHRIRQIEGTRFGRFMMLVAVVVIYYQFWLSFDEKAGYGCCNHLVKVMGCE